MDKKLLKNQIELVVYDKATSSNTLAKELACNGAKEGMVVLVKSQSEGKGRLGRRFISSSENGLYFTIILRPQIAPMDAIHITTIGATALCEAIKKTSGQNAQIKWVNDIYINDKKCAGILTESQINAENNTIDYAVIGMGINVLPPENGFDKEIADIATSIYKKDAPSGYKTELLYEIIDAFFMYYKDIEEKTYLKSYKQSSNIIGKEVDVYIGNEIIRGTAIDIDDAARLIVKTSDGISSFGSGEARVRQEGRAL